MMAAGKFLFFQCNARVEELIITAIAERACMTTAWAEGDIFGASMLET